MTSRERLRVIDGLAESVRAIPELVALPIEERVSVLAQALGYEIAANARDDRWRETAYDLVSHLIKIAMIQALKDAAQARH